MPYAPGVADRSGEIMGAGILGAMQSFSQGIAGYKQRQEENKKLESENKALELVAKSSAGTVGLPPELIDQLTVSSPDESPRAKNARLKTALTGVLTQEQLQNEQQKRQLIGAQMAQIQAKQRQEGLDREALAAAVAPVQAMRPRTPGEGQFIMRDPTIAEQRDPTESEAVLKYLQKGGSDNAVLRSLVDREQTRIQTDQRASAAEARAAAAEAKAANGGSQSPLGKTLADLARATKEGRATDADLLRRNAEREANGPDKKSDEKALTATEIQQINALQQAKQDLDALDGAYKEIGDKDWGGPLGGRLRKISSMGTDPNISRIETMVTGSTPNLARGVFREVGVLTDADVKRYREQLPDVTDTAAQRKQKFADLRARLARNVEETLSTLKAAGRNVDGVREKIVGDAARERTAAEQNRGVSFPEFASPQEVEAAIASKKLQRGAVVRINGQLFRAE